MQFIVYKKVPSLTLRLSFSAHIYNMEEQSSTQPMGFSTFTCVTIENVRTVLNLKILYHQFIAYLRQNETEIVRFPKYGRNLSFLKKVKLFVEKTRIFSKSVNEAHLLCNVYQLNFLKNVFHLKSDVFLANQKTFKFGKIRKFDGVFF